MPVKRSILVRLEPISMTFLPVAQRELRVAARRTRTYWMRTWLAGGISLVWLWLQSGGGKSGRPLFLCIGVVALGLGLLAGVFLTADCLSQERREGTFGLLFLTHLSGYDVVIGKLIAASLPVFYGLVSVLPLLAFPALFGGVTVGECWRSALVVVAALVWSLCLGLAVSAWSREARRAVAATLVIVLFLAGVLPALGRLQASLAGTAPLSFLSLLSPVALYLEGFDSAYQSPVGAHEFWLTLTCVCGVAVAALAAACVVVTRVWREGKKTWSGRGTKSWRWRWRFGSEKAREARRKLLDGNPYLWLASRDRRQAWPGTAAMLCLFFVWLGFLRGCWSTNPGPRNFCFEGAMLLAWVLHWVAKWSLAAASTRRLNQDRRSGLLGLISATPLSVDAVLDGQKSALRRAFLVPMALALLTNAGLLWTLVSQRPGGYIMAEPATVCWIAAPGGALVLFLDFRRLTWVGMSAGLRWKHHHQAMAAVLLPVLVLPLALLAFLYFLCAFSGGLGAMVLLWFFLCMVVDLAAIAGARDYLHQNLRGVDSELAARLAPEPAPESSATIHLAFHFAPETGISARRAELQEAVAFIDSELRSAGFDCDPAGAPSGDSDLAVDYVWPDSRPCATTPRACVFLLGTTVIATFTEPFRDGRLKVTARPFGLLRTGLTERYGSDRIQVLEPAQDHSEESPQPRGRHRAAL
jgi:hypothetical protein